MSTDLLGFPSPSDWKVANQKAQERIDSSNVVNIYNILEWSVVYTNSLQNFQFLGHWHGPDDIYNVAGHSPKHSSWPLPLISPTDFTIVPHTFNQFQPWYAYIRCLKSDPPFVSDSVYNRVNGALYKGWLEVAQDWLGNESQWPKAPVVPATSSLCDELEDIQHKNKDVLCVNGLIITAYEFNGYASYLMFCCINKLVETFKADAPVFCIDDRIIGAVFGNSVGDKETVWREELE
ncbi:hypothetical protein BS47DRAFT_1387293 [Hydnum rufescens UP504]|uniref:Uncharacterized protein n=1 Tax=Hydnum rufescens UP504 TaxID=1448309 RepID=A0A9P6B9J1_9AGAM|nr:hypothetical protein BS47DRAFT_1387293 [Hydnum rufescens UP504]